MHIIESASRALTSPHPFSCLCPSLGHSVRDLVLGLQSTRDLTLSSTRRPWCIQIPVAISDSVLGLPVYRVCCCKSAGSRHLFRLSWLVPCISRRQWEGITNRNGSRKQNGEMSLGDLNQSCELGTRQHYIKIKIPRTAAINPQQPPRSHFATVLWKPGKKSSTRNLMAWLPCTTIEYYPKNK